MNSIKDITVTLKTQFLMQEHLIERKFQHANLEMYLNKITHMKMENREHRLNTNTVMNLITIKTYFHYCS